MSFKLVDMLLGVCLVVVGDMEAVCTWSVWLFAVLFSSKREAVGTWCKKLHESANRHRPCE